MKSFFQWLEDIDSKKVFVCKFTKIGKEVYPPSAHTLKSAPPAQFLHIWVLRAYVFYQGSFVEECFMRGLTP